MTRVRTTILVAVVVALVLTLVLTLVAVPKAGASPADDEAAFVRDINSLRASKGVRPMSVHPQLTVLARVFAARMAANGKIFHNPHLADQAPHSWTKLGENVGVGGSQASLHQAFVASPGHLRNLLDGEYGYVGIGVLHSGGRMWVVEAFMRSDAPLPQVSPPKSPVTDNAHMATRFQLAKRAVRQ